MNRETKSFSADHTKVLNAGAGIVETVFSVTGPPADRQGDIIDAGAFSKAIANSRLPTVVFSHVWNDINQVLGRTLSWEELLPGNPMIPSRLKSAAKGESQVGCVRAQVQFDLETPAGQLAFTHVRNQNLKEWSFSFDVGENGAYYEDHKSADGKYSAPIRHIKDVSEVFELTLCVIGAQQRTETVAWKAHLASSPDWMFGAAFEAAQAILNVRRDIR
jgi:hypothetical protein